MLRTIRSRWGWRNRASAEAISAALSGLAQMRLCALAEGARRSREAARCAVGHLHGVLPRHPITSGHEVVHIGVGAVLRAAFYRHVAAVTELIDVVLDSPTATRLVAQARTHLRGDDL